jgi:hypothetical protein
MLVRCAASVAGSASAAMAFSPTDLRHPNIETVRAVGRQHPTPGGNMSPARQPGQSVDKLRHAIGSSQCVYRRHAG